MLRKLFNSEWYWWIFLALNLFVVFISATVGVINWIGVIMVVVLVIALMFRHKYG